MSESTRANPVMVSLDGSAKDARALAVGAALADLADTGLHLVRVFDLPAEGRNARAGALGVTAAAEELRAAMRDALAGTADRLATSGGPPVT